MSWTVQIAVRPDDGTDTVHYLPVEEVARMLRKNRRTIDRYITAGMFSHNVIYGVSCIPSTEVAQYAASLNGESP